MSENKKLKEEFCVFFDVLGTKSKFLTSNFEEEEKLVKKYENFIKDIKEILCFSWEIPKNKLERTLEYSVEKLYELKKKGI